MSSRNVKLMMALVCLGALAGCTDNGLEHGMEHQDKLQAYSASDFFADGRSERTPVADTVAQGELKDNVLLYTGKQNGKDSTVFPIPITQAVLERGHQRYDIFCAECHDRAGTGNGMIVRRGFPQAVSYHSDRLRNAPVGHFFDAITNGYGRMYSFGDRIPAQDRWAIVAYIRALQLSQHAALADVPADQRNGLSQTPAPSTEAAQ